MNLQFLDEVVIDETAVSGGSNVKLVAVVLIIAVVCAAVIIFRTIKKHKAKENEK